jgi:type III pantothenate kinase
MLLAIDAGNSNVTFAAYDGENQIAHWRIMTHAGRTADEYTSLLDTLFMHENLKLSDMDGVAIASVVPSVTPDLERLANRTFKCRPLIVGSTTDMGIKIAYNPPSDVGADRLVDAVAAIKKYGPAPLIVIDFGTATTFNAIGAGNIYLGGALFPGISLAWESLFTHAARLSAVSREVPPSPIGSNTTHALQSGMTFAVASLVDGMVRRFREEMRTDDCPVIATGGQSAELLASLSTVVTHIDPLLTLDGLMYVWRRWQAAQGDQP